MTTVDKDAITNAYEEVRNDDSNLAWMVCKYEENNICLAGTGENYDELTEHFSPDNRAYAFVRITTGDELSKRAKFALITWTGKNVRGLKKAKVSTDKSEVKKVIKSFAVEIATDELSEVAFDEVKSTVLKAGGANYGTGVRD